MEVYSGSQEGHNFVPSDIRYNHDRQEFEYLYDFYGWIGERQLA